MNKPHIRKVKGSNKWAIWFCFSDGAPWKVSEYNSLEECAAKLSSVFDGFLEATKAIANYSRNKKMEESERKSWASHLLYSHGSTIGIRGE